MESEDNLNDLDLVWAIWCRRTARHNGGKKERTVHWSSCGLRDKVEERTSRSAHVFSLTAVSGSCHVPDKHDAKLMFYFFAILYSFEKSCKQKVASQYLKLFTQLSLFFHRTHGI